MILLCPFRQVPGSCRGRSEASVVLALARATRPQGVPLPVIFVRRQDDRREGHPPAWSLPGGDKPVPCSRPTTGCPARRSSGSRPGHA